MKRAISLLMAVVIFAGTIPVLGAQVDRTTTPNPLFEKNTHPRSVFRIEGAEDEFILLDENADGEYYILTKGTYGSRAFDPDNTQKFDLEDANNVAYYLNHQFLEEKLLPEKILEHIDYEREWTTEAGVKNGKCPDDYTQKMGIGLLSQTEWTKYCGIFGGIDDIVGNGWWLRSPRGVSGGPGIVLMSYNPSPGTTSGWDAFATLPLRPSFYLKPDFFKKVKVQTDGLGSQIKKLIKRTVSLEELNALGYTQEEIAMIQDSEWDLIEEVNLILPETVGNVYTKPQLRFELDISLSWKEKKTYFIEYAVDGVCYPVKKAEVTPNYRYSTVLDLTNSRYGVHTLNVTIREGARVIKTFETEYGVMVPTTEQFMYDYGLKGVASHFGQENNSNETDRALMNLLNIKTFRDGVDWSKIETEKDQLKTDRGDQFIPAMTEDDGMNLILTLLFNNNLYSGLDPKKTPESTKYGPKTKKEFDGYAQYSAFMAENYPKVKIFQIWNEPFGNGFWKPNKSLADYTYMMQIAAEEIRKVRDDAIISGGSLGSSATDFLEYMMTNDGYGACDSVSYHAYIYPQKTDDQYEEMTRHFVDDVNMKYGGWKPVGLTETGWPTFLGERGISVEQQAVETVKQYVHSSIQDLKYNTIYDFRNDGTSIDNREHNFGLVYRNFNVKPAALAVKNHFSMTAGAVYIGKMQVNDTIELHGYIKNGDLVLIAWTKGANEELDLGDTLRSASAYDIFGNQLNCGAKPVLGESPIYFMNVDNSLIARIISDELEAYTQHFFDYCAQTMPVQEREKFAQKKDEFRRLLKPGMPSFEAVKTWLDEYYQMLADMTAQYTKDTAMALSGRLYTGHLIGEKASNILLWKGYNDHTREWEVPRERQRQLAAEMERRQDEVVGGRYIYTDAMLRYVANFYFSDLDKCEKETIPSLMKNGFMYTRSYSAQRILDISRQMMDTEHISSNGLIVQMPSSQRELYNFAENKTQISVYNYGKKDFNGQLQLLDYDGEEVAVMDAQMKAGENGIFELTYVLRNNTADGTKYTLNVLQDGEVIHSQAVEAVIKNRAEVSLDAAGTKLENLKNITVKVKNTFNTDLSGTVEVTPPAGWTMAQEQQSFRVGREKTADVTFELASKTKKAFNQYAFDITVKDENGDILAQGKLPLQFAVAVHAKNEYSLDRFDGSMDEWADAYPVYVAAPEDPEDETAWDNSNMAARIYTKWDENYLYILADVNDDAHHQGNNGGERIWDGDCFQIAIDSKNDKTVQFDYNDYEFGFAKTENGEAGFAWTHPEKSLVGDIKERYAKIVRDERIKRTRYLIKIPKAYISGLPLQAGTKFGLNYAVHDADLTTRERMDEVTYGIIYGKNPASYYTWSMEN